MGCAGICLGFCVSLLVVVVSLVVVVVRLVDQRLVDQRLVDQRLDQMELRKTIKQLQNQTKPSFQHENLEKTLEKYTFAEKIPHGMQGTRRTRLR